MDSKEESSLTLQEKEKMRKYMLSLIVIPGAALTVASFFLGFFINEVAKQGAYNEAYSQAYSQASGLIMSTTAEAAKTSGKLDGLYTQANKLLIETEDTRKRFELSASDLSSEIASNLAADPAFVKQVTQPITKMNDSFARRVKALEKITIPTGTVLAFDRTTCPKGWEEYIKAAGRTIVGAGQRSGSKTQRNVGEQGGEELHKLTVEELPVHDHNIKGAASGSMLSWYESRSVGAVPHEDLELNSPYNWSAGGNQAHNNMPPYVVLLYCTKT